MPKTQVSKSARCVFLLFTVLPDLYCQPWPNDKRLWLHVGSNNLSDWVHLLWHFWTVQDIFHIWIPFLLDNLDLRNIHIRIYVPLKRADISHAKALMSVARSADSLFLSAIGAQKLIEKCASVPLNHWARAQILTPCSQQGPPFSSQL